MFIIKTDSYHEAQNIRKAVFIEEQGFQDEFDEIDDWENTIHLTLFRDNEPAGCARTFPSPSETKETEWVFGRLAVLQKYRGKGLGSLLLNEAEAKAKDNGATVMILHAQCRAAAFYEANGYVSYGPIELDEHVEHIWMRKDL